MAWIAADEGFNPDEIDQPVIGIASKLVRHDSGNHRHQKGQLLFAEKGVMTIRLGNILSVLPPQRVAWIPPEITHRVSLSNVVNYRSIYIDTDHYRGLPNQYNVWNVTPLLRAVLEVIALSSWQDMAWDEDSRAGHWLSVLWDELAEVPLNNIQLPFPVDYRLQHIDFNQLPAELNIIATMVGASEKTITRIFQRETGLGYQAWRQQWRLLKAIELLSEEYSLIEIGLQLGFSGDSSFGQFFKKMTGKSPRQY